jgi:hypothetical protein
MQPNLFSRSDLYRMLAAALIKKKPLPPECWSVVKFDEEVTAAGEEYDPDLFARHHDALITCVYYLVDFACRMPEWINLSLSNARVHQMCGVISDEIEQITYEPDEVVAAHGKLKSRLTAKLAVQTCLIYREETERVIVEKDRMKRHQRTVNPAKNKESNPISRSKQWQSALAQEIFQKVCGKKSASEQPGLF